MPRGIYKRKNGNMGKRRKPVHEQIQERVARGDFRRAKLKDCDNIIKIPLRQDLQIQVTDLPHDLTRSEAEKLCKVIQAYAL